MNRRSTIFLGIFGAIVALSAAPAADPSARNFVAAIYDAYKGQSGNGIALDTDAALRRYFEPDLAALISKDRKEAADQGEAPALTGDPFVDAGDWNIADFDIAVADAEPGKATATVKFDNDEKPTKIVLDLVKLKEGWRIADITWQREDGTETLRGLFIQH
ncbi:MAG TPA: DUF3828 domain-containing protein [Xanthobacteraceae bacterium]|jgi:hypothetical protein